MLELTEQNAAEVLVRAGRVADPRETRVRELSGGVSNVVLLVEAGDSRHVVKQARGKLRVAADWQCSIERIWREVAVLEAYQSLLASADNQAPAGGSVPRVLWIDRELYAYAMTAAPVNARTWKEQLLAGNVSLEIAATCGQLLGTMHAASWQRADLAEKFDDRTYFRELRLEPYYAFAAERYPPLAGPLRQLIDSTWKQQLALVHGDFSPKNLLVTGGRGVGETQQLLLIDFEVGHFGDPAFDLGFFLTHLLLKSIHLRQSTSPLLAAYREFWQAYSQRMQLRLTAQELNALKQRTKLHLAGCLVARVHGKSPVDYLGPAEQKFAVRVATSLFAQSEPIRQ